MTMKAVRVAFGEIPDVIIEIPSNVIWCPTMTLQELAQKDTGGGHYYPATACSVVLAVNLPL
jgi:hypothetical protein